MSRRISSYLGAIAIGFACHFLQPAQPASSIATVLIVGALWAFTWEIR